MLRTSLRLCTVSSLALSITACADGSDPGATGASVGQTDSMGTLTTASTTGATDSDTATATDGTSAGSASATGTTTGASDTATATDSSGTSDTATTGPGMCTGDGDCAGDPGGPVCDNGTCVPCTPQNDVCAVGTYCDDANTCTPGCLDTDDCPNPLVCNTVTNQCEGCVEDNDCGLGTVCDMGTCIPGCNQMQPCQAGAACCTDQCVDLNDDPNNCGMCDNVCAFDNATPACNMGICELDTCDGGFADCNVNPQDGCETNGACACMPGEQQACYTGPFGTEGVGQCVGGTQTCNAQGTSFGPCMNEVKPGAEICGNQIDDDCDMTVDEDPDNDNDGWTLCGGDCCDVQGPTCLNPELVNPGAFEVGGNMVDDDCDGVIDNPLPSCDAGLASNSANPDDYAKAIDLCQFTTENPPNPANKKWGVIQSQLLLANGAGAPAANSRSIRSGFGNNIGANFGSNLAVMSTGNAADLGDNNPGFAAFQNGASMGTASPFPADYQVLPNAPGCPAPTGTTANNPVNLKIRVRVPTNAQSFSVDLYFFSAEYPEYVCTVFNDFFVTLVDSTAANNPADKNIAVYDDGNNLWPLGVNILQAAPGLFTQCSNGAIGQCGTGGAYNGCTGTTELVGTGFDTQGPTSFSCGYAGRHGGGTGWLNVNGNVTPGETMEIRFIIWDTSDQLFDSLVLLDNWQWSVQASDPGITPG